MSKSITIDIQGGAVRIEASGFSGGDCDKATKFIEDELGDLQKTKKPEYAGRLQHGQQAKARA